MKQNQWRNDFPDYIPEFAQIRRDCIIEEGKRFMQNSIPEKTPYFRLFSQQLRYISPVFWIWQVLIFLGVLFLSISIPGGEMFAGELLYYTGPLVGILAYPEMFRDLFYDMSEIENSCKNNSATLFTMRLLIVGIMNLFLLTVLAAVTSQAWDDSFLRTAVFGLTPFLWIHLTALPLLHVMHIRSRIGALALSALMTATAWILGVMKLHPLEMEYGSMLIWTFALAMGAILLSVELGILAKERKNGEEGILWS
ncbi:MAG: hypothetical protein MRZ97_08270 [Firmicutes bacterium]|nr:hypothetical protein [Bacillota bacterium]